MLDYTILANKKQITKEGPDGYYENQYDLLTPVINNVNIPAQDMIVVNEFYVARPDLISLAVYGDDKYADLICKYNGISNPFEINENDVIYIPSLSRFDLLYNDKFIPSEFIKDEDKDSFREKENKFQKELNESRSPAQQVVGETNFVIDKSAGVVFY